MIHFWLQFSVLPYVYFIDIFPTNLVSISPNDSTGWIKYNCKKYCDNNEKLIYSR